MRAIPAAGLEPTLTLVCFAHAGGNASLYRQWQRALPPWIEVRALDLPGRGTRRASAPLASWSELIAQVGTDLADVLASPRPFAVFGHSMGALVGLEWLRLVKRERGREPVWFGVSGSVWPARRPVEQHWLVLPDEEIVRRLRERGGTPKELLDDAAFLEMVLPVLRADFHLCGIHPLWLELCQALREGEATEASGLLSHYPLSVFLGNDDPATVDAVDVAAWSQATTGACRIHRFAGGHFFLSESPDSVLQVVSDALTAAMPVAKPRELSIGGYSSTV